MTEDVPESVARSLLDALQAAADDHDAAAFGHLLTDDAVVLGTTAAHLDRAAVDRYVDEVFSVEQTLRWAYDDVRVVHARDGAVTFVGLGSIGFDGDAKDPFRLTCLAVRDGGRWRIRLFHGSVPQAETVVQPQS